MTLTRALFAAPGHLDCSFLPFILCYPFLLVRNTEIERNQNEHIDAY